MFKPFQVVQFKNIFGIVSAVDGRFVTIMWEEGRRAVDFKTSSAIQWSKCSLRIVG